MLLVLRWVLGRDGAAKGDNSRFKSKPGKKEFVKPAVLTDYSAEEVAKHCTAGDCWLIIDGKVYDVTTYVPDHPGDLSIAAKAGQDNSVRTVFVGVARGSIVVHFAGGVSRGAARRIG